MGGGVILSNGRFVKTSVWMSNVALKYTSIGAEKAEIAYRCGFENFSEETHKKIVEMDFANTTYKIREGRYIEYMNFPRASIIAQTWREQ